MEWSEMTTDDPIEPGPELRAEAITAEAVERARTALVHAAIEFDNIEDSPGDGDWRFAFGKLREAAEALGCLRVLRYYGIG